jgi:hypothetical protein
VAGGGRGLTMYRCSLELLMSLLDDFKIDYLSDKNKLRNDKDCYNARYGLDLLLLYINKMYLEAQDDGRE